MPIEVNPDGSETDTGTGLHVVKPNHMSPADQATQPDDDPRRVAPVTEESSPVVKAEQKASRRRH